MALPTLLFDLDGTITDPAPGFLASIHYALEEMQIPAPPDNQLVRYIGPPLRESLGELLGTEDSEAIERALELYRWRLDNGGKFEARVHDGMRELLEHYAGAGHALYVCTGKPEGVATEIIEYFGLSKHFQHVYGAKLDGRFCEKAELIAHIWEVEAIDDPAGAMVGDTVFDMQGAKANGLGTVAVDWGFGQKADLLAAGADHYVSSAAELQAAIDELIAML